MGLYIAFAFMVGAVFLGRWITWGWFRRFGLRWWNVVLATLVSWILFLMPYNAFGELGGDYWYGKAAGMYLLYEIVTAYYKVKEEKAAKSATS